MAATPRAGYLPRGIRARAHEDMALPLGHESTCSQPTTVRTMLELLGVPEGGSVLDVGSGSGWTTAILARLVGPGGQVLGVELVPELVADAATRLARDGLTWASVREATDGILGAPDEAPFDRVLVSAMASVMPYGLVDQLAHGGLMVLPLRGRMVTLTRTATGEPQVLSRTGRYLFVPLIEPPQSDSPET